MKMQATTQSMLRVFLIEESPIYTEGVRSTLGTKHGISVVGASDGAPQALASIKVLKPDVVICSIDCITFEQRRTWMKTLLKQVPETIFLTARHSTLETIDGYQLGAKGFFDKKISPDELIKAVFLAREGRAYFTADVAVELARFSILGNSYELGLNMLLTAEEIELLRYLGDGLTEQEIAVLTNTSKRAVTYSKGKLKEKLNITRLSSFTKIGIKHDLIDIENLT